MQDKDTYSLSQLRLSFPRRGVVGDTLKRGASESQFCPRPRFFFTLFTSTQSLSTDRSCPSRTTYYNVVTGGLMEEGFGLSRTVGRTRNTF